MKTRWPIFSIAVLFAFLTSIGLRAEERPRVFKAGAAVVDITPTQFPVYVDGNFTERIATKAFDTLHVRSVVLDDGTSRIAIAVVDTCMMPRELIDRAKDIATKETGIPTDKMLVSATHTHEAPAAMGCLGTRPDKNYAEWLPGKIAEAIITATKNLQPARVGWAAIDDWDHTFNRRWLRRSDKMLSDPFGQKNIRANMHPGYQNADTTGPSGPVDPGLTVVAVQTLNGKPLALLANYSQHYFGTAPLSADYFGLFAKHIAKCLSVESGDGPGFVGIMSQGTSGDLARMDYSSTAQKSAMAMDMYAAGVAEKAFEAYKTIVYRDWVPLAMAESKLTLKYRVPDEQRLEWARKMIATFEGRIPKNQPEIYAQEALRLHDKQQTELKLQAVRIGDLGITAIPNEVYCITGLKLKAQSPFPITFNMALANGAEGYIPPTEQHKLGGYTTWPARTAGLEVEAEPKIVEAVLSLLETVSGQKRRAIVDEHGTYAKAVLDSKPAAYWRLNDIVIAKALDATGNGRDAKYEDGVALYLHGPENAAFSGTKINRAVHFAGGRMRFDAAAVGEKYSVEFWFWNPFPDDVRAVTGYLFSNGPDGDKQCPGDHLGIGGTYKADSKGKLFLFNGNAADEMLAGKTVLGLKQWHHVVLARDGKKAVVYLDGNKEPEISGDIAVTRGDLRSPIYFGGRSDNFTNFEGKLDEIALYDKVLSADEASAHYRISGMEPPKVAKPRVDTPALSPEESLKTIHIRDGYEVELVAAEPLVKSPVAFDWDGQGRLWVVEMADYPMGMDGKGKRGGRVRMLEDTKGTGVYDKSTLFADGLNFPNGILTWRDGVLVTAAPDILYLRDTDGDGKADEIKPILSGFPEGNQQLRVNGLRWGLDNWVHCGNGGHHGNYNTGTKITSPLTHQSTHLGARDFSFRPDSGDFEPQSGPTQFGRNRDDWGNWFGVQNSRPIWHYVMQDHYLRRNPFVAPPNPIVNLFAELNPRVYPASAPGKRYHSFEHAFRFTSACAAVIERGNLFNDGLRHAFMCEPVSNLVQHVILNDDGVSFTSHRDGTEKDLDFFASEDPWCRPVMVRSGPDGALYVADMYRFMIEHPDWLPKNGRDELLPFYREGENAGRIYRIYPKGKRPAAIPRLDALSNTELAQRLGDPNGWVRDRAQMMLLWRGARDVVPELTLMATEDIRLLARLHATCALDGLAALKAETVAALLADKDPRMRTQALRLSEKFADDAVIAASVKLAGDDDAKVRLQLACTLGEWKDARAGAALAKLLARDSNNVHIAGAIYSSALPHLTTLAAAPEVARGDWRTPPVTPLLQSALGASDGLSLTALLNAIQPPGEADTKLPLHRYAVWLELLAARGTTADTVCAKLNDAPLRKTIDALDALSAKALERLQKESLSATDKGACGTIVALTPRLGNAALELFQRWLATGAAFEDQELAVTLIARMKRAETPEILLRDWKRRTPALRNEILDALMSSEAWTMALLKAVKDGAVPTSSFDGQRQARMRQHSSAKVKAAAASAFQNIVTAERQAVIEKFKPALALEGDAVRGKATFATLCIACHRKDGVGKEIGPDLRSVVQHPPEELLVSILDPNAVIVPGYVAWNCKLKTGEYLYGILATETATSVSFKLSDESVRTILRSDIADLRCTQTSLMPEGLETSLTPQALADLIRYIKTPEQK